MAAQDGTHYYCDGETYYLAADNNYPDRLVAAVDGGEMAWVLAIKDQQGTLNLA